MIRKIACALAMVFFASSALADTWKIDPDHSAAFFGVEHMGIAIVRGSFAGVSGAGEIDARGTLRSLQILVDVKSLDTGVAKRDTHLKGPDFFDVSKYPIMTFVSTHIKDLGPTLEIEGDALIHGVSKKIVLVVGKMKGPTLDPWGGTRFGVRIAGIVSRSNFNITWNDPMPDGSPMVGDLVDLVMDVEFIQPKK